MQKILPAQVTLNALRDGHVMNELAQAIHEATCAVRDMGKSAEVHLSITFQPIKGVEQGLREAPISLISEVSIKLPKPPQPTTLFYVDVEGNPTRNPAQRQPELGLSVAKTGENAS